MHFSDKTEAIKQVIVQEQFEMNFKYGQKRLKSLNLPFFTYLLPKLYIAFIWEDVFC